MKRETEVKDRALLRLEIVLGTICTASALAMLFITMYFVRNIPLAVGLYVLAVAIFVVGIGYCLKIKQSAGFYECAEYGHRYVPSYRAVFWAMHAGRPRYMTCPHCGQKSWNKKVLTKE